MNVCDCGYYFIHGPTPQCPDPLCIFARGALIPVLPTVGVVVLEPGGGGGDARADG